MFFTRELLEFVRVIKTRGTSGRGREWIKEWPAEGDGEGDPQMTVV